VGTVTSFKLNKYDFAAAYLNTWLLTWIETDVTFVCLESYLFISWTKKGIIVTPTAGRGRKLAFQYYLPVYHSLS